MAKRKSAIAFARVAPWAIGCLLAAQQMPPMPSPPSFGEGLSPPSVTAPSVSPVTMGNQGAAGTASGAAGSAGSATASTANAALSMSSLLGDSTNSLLSSLLGQDAEATGTDDDQLLAKMVELLQGKGASAGVSQSAGDGNAGAGAGSAAVTATATGAGAKAAAGAQARAAAPQKTLPGVSAAGAAGVRPASGADIARFTLGAYDVTPTITLLVTSSVAANGTFLLSGDRSYPSSGKTLRETFYFLCRREADGSYALHADVLQETANEWSACRRLAKLGAIRGEAAGNQILFRASDAAGPIYLLLSVFGPTAEAYSVR